MRADGRVSIGAMVQEMTPKFGTGNNFQVSMETDAAFSGTGTFDRDGNFKSDGTLE